MPRNDQPDPESTEATDSTPTGTPTPAQMWVQLSEGFRRDGKTALFVLINFWFGKLIFGIIKKLTPGIPNKDDWKGLHVDALIGIVEWIAQGLRTDSVKLTRLPPEALVRRKVRTSVIDWLRKESRRSKRFQALGYTDPAVATPGTQESGDHQETTDPDWDALERNLNNIINVLRFTEHERLVFQAYFHLQRSFASAGLEMPKRGSLLLLADEVAKLTGHQVSQHYVKRHLTSGRVKRRAFLKRQAGQLFGDMGGTHAQYEEAKRTGTGAQSPGRRRYSKGGGHF